MAESSIQRLLMLLIFTAITVGIQYFIIKELVNHSLKKQILVNVLISLFWSVLAFYSAYKEYRNTFFYVCMGYMIFYIITSYLTIKGDYYDSRKIAPRYKTIITIAGFVTIVLALLSMVEIYLFLAIIETLILLTYFIDYKNFNKYYGNEDN